MSSFEHTFGEPTPENFQKALDSIIQGIEKAGGQVGEEDSYFPESDGMEAGGIVDDMAEDYLMFEIRVTEDSIIVAPGTIDTDTHAEETKASPANGTWYIESKVVINSTTGAITSTDLLISSSASTTTSTDFYFTIGTVVVSGGVPAAPIQFTYGPILVLPHGAIADKWGVLQI